MSNIVLKAFLFDNGLSLPKSEQTQEKINNMIIHVIEYNNVDVPKDVQIWYNNNRSFDINVNNIDILNEIINQMNLQELDNFCKTNKEFQAYCGKLLSKKILQEQGFYLLDKPETYQEWITVYKRSREAIYKTDRLLSVLNYEKEQGYGSPWLFLFVEEQNCTKINLTDYANLMVDDINQYNNMEYNGFNMLLNIDLKSLYYKYIKNEIQIAQLGWNIDVHDTLHRYFYYYPDESMILIDVNDLFFNEGMLEDYMYSLDGELLNIASRRLQFIKNY